MKPFSLCIQGRIVTFSRPAVMAIINATPDSFYAGSRCQSADAIADAAQRALDEEADIIDLGAYSSRPGADDVTAEDELNRLAAALEAIRSVSSSVPVSVDTFRADVAARCVSDYGADIINDISGGDADSAMFDTVASLHVPYILMHMRGTPATMQTMTDYPQGVTAGVIAALAPKIERLALLGVDDVIVDPGFGFAKTLDQNYIMLRELDAFAMLGKPVLAGMSRKSMATRLLGIDASEALEATVALNTIALLHGASLLRVHDVRAARQAVEIVTRLQEAK